MINVKRESNFLYRAQPGILPIVADGLTTELLVSYVSSVVDGETVTEGTFYTPVECVSLERTPVAFALYAVGS